MVRESTSSRRGLISGGLALGVVAIGWQRWGVRRPKLGLEAIAELPGWRRGVFGPVSTGSGSATDAVFVGIDAADSIAPLPLDRLCSIVHQNQVSGSVPIAHFTDVNCPYCKLLMSRLITRDEAVTWHELPLLGPSSELAARAGAAAGLQGGYVALQTNLMATPFRPSRSSIASVAQEAGLDADKLLEDMDTLDVTEQLETSRAAAATLGIYGTPGLVIGKTVLMGNIDDRTLDRVIAEERSRSSTRC